jgi:acyl carrier protein
MPVASARRTRGIRAEAQNYVPPQSETEKTIAGVWQGLFGLERVSVEENFFDLGGHSLLLVHMHERLRETLKLEFPIVTLFEYPTVQSLGRHLDSPRGTQANGEQWRDRARLQKQALAQMRPKAKREGL